MIKGIILKPYAKPEVIEFGHELKDLQNLVEGYIESVHVESLNQQGIDVWCNGEGKLKNLEPSAYLLYQDQIYDIISGNIVFTSFDGDGETISLNDSQIEYLSKLLDNHHIAGRHGMLPYITQEGVY